MSRVVLHIGLQKTGSTSLQYWMRDHEALLAEHNVRFPRGWLRLNNHFELGLAFTRADRMTGPRTRADEWRSLVWRDQVLTQVLDDLSLHQDETTVLSNESLSLLRYDEEVAALRNFVGEAHVVMYLRNPMSFLASLEAQYLKNGLSLSDDPDAYNYVKPDSWLIDYESLLSLWRTWFEYVTVIDYDVVTELDWSVIPSFARRIHVPVTPDMQSYWLNKREDPTPRIDGNRSWGLKFGQIQAADRRLSAD
jgi:hypothetical protein